MEGFKEDDTPIIETPLPASEAGDNSMPESNPELEFYSERYILLKEKEFNGKLKKEELDELLLMDFQDYIVRNPPIKEIFSPSDELARVKSLPSSERRAAMASFKERYMEQKEALAACRLIIERAIESNNDTPKEELLDWVDKFSERYGFTKEQIYIAKSLIFRYFMNRERAIDFRKMFPNNVDLVHELTGLKFPDDTKFDVSVGPMSLDITTDAINSGIIFKHTFDQAKPYTYGAFATHSSHEHPVLYNIINSEYGGENAEISLIHEQQHQKNTLFREQFDRPYFSLEEPELFTKYYDEEDPELKKALLETYFRFLVDHSFDNVKDEVFAMKKDRTDYDFSNFFEKDKSAYDYLGPVRDWEEKKDDPVWQDVAEKILVQEYEKTLHEALDAFAALEHDGGYSREEIIALLTDEPMTKWPKVAQRILKRSTKKV